MRRQGQYSDSAVNTYVTAPSNHGQTQRMESNSSQFEGRLEAFTPERDNPFENPKVDGHWRWERGGSKISSSLNPHIFNDGQGGDAARAYFQSQRPEVNMTADNQINRETRSQPRSEDMDIGYEDTQTFQGVDLKFRDELLKLAKDQIDAEDTENARHREKISAINAQYDEQLGALRARHANRRDEFLLKESSARMQQYQQLVADRQVADPHGLAGFPASAAEVAAPETNRSYGAEQYDSYRERARFLGNPREHVFEPRVTYPGGRVYNASSRYYPD